MRTTTMYFSGTALGCSFLVILSVEASNSALRFSVPLLPLSVRFLYWGFVLGTRDVKIGLHGLAVRTETERFLFLSLSVSLSGSLSFFALSFCVLFGRRFFGVSKCTHTGFPGRKMNRSRDWSPSDPTAPSVYQRCRWTKTRRRETCSSGQQPYEL